MLAEMRIMIRLLRVLSSQALKASKDGDGTSSLINLFHCLTALMIKKLFLSSSLNLVSHHACVSCHNTMYGV